MSLLCVVSPAKALDFGPLALDASPTMPRLLEEAGELGKVARQCSRSDFRSLMDLSEDLADLTYERFQAFDPEHPERSSKPAIYAFNGDTYRGFDIATLKRPAVEEAQKRLRILSGLYGVLKPLDLIQAYRLEMGTRLPNPKGRDLYAFWKEEVTALLNADIEEAVAVALVNCASVEYFKAVDTKKLSVPVITPVFKEERAGAARVVSFYAKRARGMMARFIVENDVRDADGLKAFDMAGYRFRAPLSDAHNLVFTRLQDEE